MIKKKVFGSVVAVLTAFTLCGCGGWSCPEFFEAFEAAL